jgi:hypothetical protein
MDEPSEIATQSPVAEAIVRVFAARKRNATATELDAIVGLPEVERMGTPQSVKRDAILFFRALEKAGYGQFVVGRRGKHTRFTWSRSLLDFASEALRGLADLPADQPGQRPETVRRAEPAVQITHSIAVRPGLGVTFDLPEDLSAAEAERLANLIKNIPFTSYRREP